MKLQTAGLVCADDSHFRYAANQLRWIISGFRGKGSGEGEECREMIFIPNSRNPIAMSLLLQQFVFVEFALRFHQVFVCSGFHARPVLQHQNPAGIPDRRLSMRHNKRCSAFNQPLYRFLD